MKTSLNRVSKEQTWRERVARAARHSGTVLDFCRREGVSREALRYWQRKLKTKQALVPTASFARVEVLEVPTVGSRPMPDAKWLAELILHLHEHGGRR